MAIHTTTNINVDFYDKKYILINAKQHDKYSRFLSVACHNQGKKFPLNSGEHAAYIRYKKADDYAVFNWCDLDRNGNVIVELTEQMLHCDGICYADLVIVNKGMADVNTDTGEIIAIDNASVLSTMTFCIDVSETAVDNSDIESSYEYHGLSELLIKAEADYNEVILTSKSYATGEGNGIRENEAYDNAKYYSEQSATSASNAKVSENNAFNSASAASSSAGDANRSAIAASNSEIAAKKSEDASLASEQNAKASETNAKASEEASKKSEDAALVSEQNAKASEETAKKSEDAALVSEQNAKASETNAASSEENAHNYCEVVKSVVDGLNSGFIPMGTISFSELATAEKATGFTYNINEDFVTDESFAEGAGKSYTAGVNVYCRSDGLWDAFGGAASPTATVDEVKNYLGI